MLDRARTLDDFKAGIDIAGAAEALLRGVEDAHQAALHAAEVKLRFERKAGEWLARQPKNTGVRMSGTAAVAAPENVPRLADLGVNEKQSRNWQRVASIPEPEFEEYVTESLQTGTSPTRTGACRAAGVEPPRSRDRKERSVSNLRLVNDSSADDGAKRHPRSIAAAEFDERVRVLIEQGLAPNEIATELRVKVGRVHLAKRRLGLNKGRVSPLRRWGEFAVEFTDAWQDALSALEGDGIAASDDEVRELSTKLEAMVFVTKRLLRALRRRLSEPSPQEPGEPNEHEQVRET